MLVVKVPGTNSSKEAAGCERAGNEILNSLKEIFSNESGKPIDIDLLDLEEIHIDNRNLGLTYDLIYKNCLKMFSAMPKTLFLGGDHSISYPVSMAFLDFCRSSEAEPCLMVFDAHADCRKSPGGDFPTSREWIRMLVEKGFPARNILLVGARNIRKDETEFLRNNRIRIITMNQIIEDIDDACDLIMEFSDGKNLHVSIDIDVIDPAFAPSTEYPEPGGLTSRQFIYMIQRINRIRNLKGVDITEINEKKDAGRTSVNLGAKILAELI